MCVYVSNDQTGAARQSSGLHSWGVARMGKKKGVKPYKCDWAGCDAAFSQSGHLSRHRRTILHQVSSSSSTSASSSSSKSTGRGAEEQRLREKKGKETEEKVAGANRSRAQRLRKRRRLADGAANEASLASSAVSPRRPRRSALAVGGQGKRRKLAGQAFSGAVAAADVAVRPASGEEAVGPPAVALLPDRLALLERAAVGSLAAGEAQQPLLVRLSRLEQQLLGEAKKGGMVARLGALESLLGVHQAGVSTIAEQ